MAILSPDTYTMFTPKPVPHKDRTVVPVCFGDIFLTTYSQIFGPVAGIWEHLRSSLSGHGEMEKDFAERSWAALLSVPMVPEEEVQAH